MKHPAYRPVSRRQAVWIAVAAVTMAVTIVLTMLSPPGGVQRTRKLPADAQACAEGQQSGCVGGKVDVILPAASGAAPGAVSGAAPGAAAR
jgi:hypothetical protein